MTTSRANSFTRTGKTWAVLLFAAMAWLATSVWAYRVAAVHESQNTEVAKGHLEQESLSSEQARLAMGEEVVEPSSSMAEQRTEEPSSPAVEQATEESSGLAAEQSARQVHPAKSTAQEQLLKTTEERQVEAARLALRAAKEAVTRQRQLEARNQATQQKQLAMLEAKNAAAEEARRVAESAARLAAYDNLRKEELGVLDGLSARVRFRGGSEVVDRELERVLDRVFDPLFLYAEMPVTISVATNEYPDVAENTKLSRDRSRALIAYLVSRGLVEDRFSVQADSGENLPFGSHRVRVLVEEPIE